MPWTSLCMSTPSNSTLATSLKVRASSTRRNGDFPSPLRRTEERMTPVYVHQTDMIIQNQCMQLCLVATFNTLMNILPQLTCSIF